MHACGPHTASVCFPRKVEADLLCCAAAACACRPSSADALRGLPDVAAPLLLSTKPAENPAGRLTVLPMLPSALSKDVLDCSARSACCA